MTMILNRQGICAILGGCSWRTAQRRLQKMGLEPRRAGHEAYLTDEQIVNALADDARWMAVGALHEQQRSDTVPHWDQVDCK
jgi:hypothetical protein